MRDQPCEHVNMWTVVAKRGSQCCGELWSATPIIHTVHQCAFPLRIREKRKPAPTVTCHILDYEIRRIFELGNLIAISGPYNTGA